MDPMTGRGEPVMAKLSRIFFFRIFLSIIFLRSGIAILCLSAEIRCCMRFVMST